MPAAKRIGQDDLRNHNMSVVLSTIARSRVPMSRAALAKSIGLTKATMSLLTDILLRNGVLRELAPTTESTYGRPATPLAFAPGRWAGIGMQINTDGIGYVALDVSGDIVCSDWHERTMVNIDPDAAFAELDDMMRPVERDLAERGYRIAGSRLALPGLVTNGDRLLVARNFGWHDIDLNRYAVFSRLDASADNEATLAAIAQIPGYASQRADRDWPIGPLDSFVYVSTDIGIGGAYVREGQIVRGDHGFAGEIGHICVDLHGSLCRCGRHGCLETIAGRRALTVAAGLAEGDDSAAAGTELLPDLYAAWRGGDAKAALAVERALSALAAALASTVNMIDMENIVLGGLWSGFGDGLLADLERRVQSQILARDATRVRLMFPLVTEHPAMRGAAVMGLRRLFDDPMRFMAAD